MTVWAESAAARWRRRPPRRIRFRHVGMAVNSWDGNTGKAMEGARENIRARRDCVKRREKKITGGLLRRQTVSR
jgi:hypothetical protein